MALPPKAQIETALDVTQDLATFLGTAVVGYSSGNWSHVFDTPLNDDNYGPADTAARDTALLASALNAYLRNSWPHVSFVANYMGRSTATPEGSVTADPGSIRSVNISGAGSAWVKQSGTGNAGWAQLAVTGAAGSFTTGTFSSTLTVDGVSTLDGVVLGYDSGYTALQGEDSTGVVRYLVRLVSNTESRFGDEAVVETVADALSNVWFRTGGARRWRVNSTGDLLPHASGYDLATSGTPVDTGYFGIVVASSYVTINGTRYYSDSGSPNGVLDAPEGSHYTDEDTGYRYRNTSSGSGTTWTSLERIGWSIAGFGEYSGTSQVYFTFQDTTPSTIGSLDHVLFVPSGLYVTRLCGQANASVGNATWEVEFVGVSGGSDTVVNDHSTDAVFETAINLGPSQLGDYLRVSVDPTSGSSTGDYWVWVEGYRLLG